MNHPKFNVTVELQIWKWSQLLTKMSRKKGAACSLIEFQNILPGKEFLMSQSGLWGWVKDVGRSCGFAPQSQTTPMWVRAQPDLFPNEVPGMSEELLQKVGSFGGSLEEKIEEVVEVFRSSARDFPSLEPKIWDNRHPPFGSRPLEKPRSATSCHISAMEKLTGSWIPSALASISPPPIVHVIDQGRLVWDHGTSNGTGKVWSLRADPVLKYGPDHFSIGERKRKGTQPSTLKKCILRSSCSLQWTSPQVAERWTRFSPVLTSFEKVQLVNADESDLALVDLKLDKIVNLQQLLDLKLDKIVNLQQLRSLARRLRFPAYDCSIDDVSLTEVSSGRVLQDESDLSSSRDLPVVRVSSYIADIDLSHAKSIPDIFASLAEQTKRPEGFISLESRCPDGSLRKLERFHHLQSDSAVIQVQLTKTVGEWWLSNRLIIVDIVGHLATVAATLDSGENRENSGEKRTQCLRCLRCLDLSEARSLSDSYEAIGRHTSRPGRFVRFLLEGEELKVWSPNQFHQIPLTLTLQLAPCIQELLQSGLQVKYLSGEDAFETSDTSDISVVGIQDLREAIAVKLKIRATAVSLITSSGKNLWDSDPFDLCDITNETITVCVRNPELCLQGHHDIFTFCNGGYFDQICIHCGDEFFMEGRIREPRRYWP
eukprot:s2039_g20.t1